MDVADLNPEQRRAVEHEAGPAIVVAGAGTGKTRVITHRIARLIERKLAPPEAILALTFTEKAAGEMLERLDSLVGWQAYRVNVMTFHAFGGQLLSLYGHHGGMSTRGEIIPDIAKLVLLKQALSQVQLSYYGHQADILDFLQLQLDYIGALQNADISPKRYAAYVKELKASGAHALDVAEASDHLVLYELYEQIKQRHGLIDYHDQIELPVKLLHTKPNLAQRLREQYHYVLVDEYQDTNGAQDALLRAFVPPDGNIFVVGDDDQAIYGFRGARLANILSFSDHFKGAKPYVLQENFRSTQALLDAAHGMISHNDPERLEAKLGINKQLKGQTPGQPPIFAGYADAAAEYKGVAAELASRLAQGQEARELAVLATSHAALKNLARQLRSQQVPYHLTSTVNIFEQREIVQLWHLSTWLVLGASDETIINLLMGPFFGWEAAQVRAVSDIARQGPLSMEAALEQAAAHDKTARQAVESLKLWRQWARQGGASHLLYRLVFETGLSQQWVEAAAITPRMVKVFEDLQLWLRHAQQYEYVALDPSLAGYMATFPKPPEIESDELVGDADGVALLTIHAAKGLEFERVFIINNTFQAWGEAATGRRQALPPELAGAGNELAPEHEKRRLLYVAITRAKSELTLSAPFYQAGGRSRRLNPFLSEIFAPKQLAPKDRPPVQEPLDKALQELQQFRPSTMNPADPKLPFEAADGWLELSVTDLSQYGYCPYEFYLEKVLKIRRPAGPSTQFGSLLHSLFHEYYQSKLTGQVVALSELTQKLDERWSRVGYRTLEEAETDRQRAISTLNSFYTREQAASREVRASEEAFSLSLPEAKLRVKGKIDVTFKTSEGVEVRDFKTGRKRDADKLADEARGNLQLRTYALAVEEMEGAAPAQVVLDYVVSGVEGVAELTPRILSNHRQKLAKIADQIRARQFEPNPDLYHQCVAYKYWGTPDDDA